MHLPVFSLAVCLSKYNMRRTCYPGKAEKKTKPWLHSLFHGIPKEQTKLNRHKTL